LVLAVCVVLVVTTIVPIVVAMSAAGGYVLEGPVEVFALAMRFSPMALVFPLAVAVPYAVELSSQISQRYLVYTRTRAALGDTLRARLFAAGVSGFVIGFIAVLIPYVWAFFIEPMVGMVKYEANLYVEGAENLVPMTAAQLRDAELSAYIFSQLLAYGDWAYGLGYGLFVGVAGGLFSVVAACCLLMMNNRFLAIATPWIVYVVAYFVMAVFSLAAISPNVFFPFNLVQVELFKPMIPFAVLTGVTVILVGTVLRKATSWESCQ
jgi:ABC-type multidrug transport system fused ATPase/permease subunit